jgi:putative hydrolase of the HAD superfamily
VPPAKIRAIIFDIGRVLVRVDVSRVTSGLATGASFSPSELWAAIENDPRWLDWQQGHISPRDWYLHLSKRLDVSLSFEEFTDVWNHALDPQPIQEDALLEGLAKKYRLALLSNTDPIHVVHLESNFAFFRFFPIRIYSCTLGACKPDPLIYREALQACKVEAGQAVYIDDIPTYVEAAQRLGIAGIHFESPNQLAAALAELGVQP